MAKDLNCDGLLYYKYIIQFVGERIVKIDQHFTKLQAKWLIVSYAPFAFNFYLQRR